MIIDGKSLAEKIRQQTKKEIAVFKKTPGLAVILVGDDPASRLYVSLKERACAEVGIHFEKHLFPASVSEGRLIDLIQKLNQCADIDGILVQLPLPSGLNENRVISAIAPDKDVDGFHPKNLAALKNGHPRLIPGVAKGIVALIDSTGVNLKGKHAALVVNSAIFAKPITYLLKKRGLRAHVYFGNDVHLDKELPHADVLVVAVGHQRFIKAEWIKRGAIVIDVGTNKMNGKVVGDVDFENATKKAGWITPVPGGVGPMTVAMLLENVVEATKKRLGFSG